MNTRPTLPLLIALVFAACGGSNATRSSTTPGGMAGGAAPAGGPAYESAAADSAAPAPQSGAVRYHQGGDSAGAYQPAPQQEEVQERPTERPGLGTVFGETMNSHVQMKPFVRASSSPFATVAMHYNDAEGVRAHVGYVGSNQLAPFSAHTPHGGISIALTDTHGNVLPGGLANGRAFVVGVENQRYNIVLRNQTGGRYEVVASVDGLDVIDGRPADLGKRGYILEPYGTLTIDGFRRSQYQVAAFRFGRVSQSYAARTSGDRNVGVIGVGFFAEKGSVWTTDQLHRRDTANPFPGDRAYARPPGY